MKKKSSFKSQAAKTKAHTRRENTHFCGAAAIQSGALDRIALRVIMSDIPKYKTGGNMSKTVADDEPADEPAENG